jgi:hypothetical protein
MILFGLALALAAAPLLWFDLDPKAGDKLLQLMSKKASFSQTR